MDAKLEHNHYLKASLEDGECIGSIMRGERMTMGFTVEDVHEKLRIKKEIIEALEDADLSSVGTSNFLVGYVRSYANLLKLDPGIVIEAYEKQSGLQRPNSDVKHKSAKRTNAKSSFALGAQRPVSSKKSFFSTVGQTASVAAVLMTSVVLIGGLVYGGSKLFGNFQQLEVVPTQQRPIAVTENEMNNLAGSEVLAENENIAINYDLLYQRQALETPVVEPRAGRIADLDVNQQGAFPQVSPSAPSTFESASTPQDNTAEITTALNTTSVDQGPVVTVGPNVPHVELLPLGEAWVRLTNEDGEVIFEQLLQPGEVVNVPFDGIVPILRKAGNANQIFLRVNGQIYGPVGKDGATVVDNVALVPESIDNTFEKVSDEMIAQLKVQEDSFLASNRN